MADRLFEVVPAETLIAVRLVATDAVIVEALSPKLTPLEFEKVMADRLFEVVPAETLIAVRLVAMLAVIVWPAVPKVIPFAFEKTTVPLV